VADESLVSERQGGVLKLTLNRPDRMNAIDHDLSDHLERALLAARDPDVRAVVVTGNERAFCAGLDLASVQDAYDPGPPPLGNWVRRDFNPVVRALLGVEKPVLAAVAGVAAGAGMGVALACDYRVADPGTRFVLAFPGVGVGLDSGVSFFLPRLVGLGRAWQIVLGGQPVGGEEAVAIGLAQELAPAGGALERAMAVATRLAEGPTMAYGLIKRAFLHAAWTDVEATLDHEAELQDVAGRTQDHLEGVRAFLAKRTPRFAGE
jgi:2-(1,2-epoxy-1,2-dihydrophenyl)acetyl-CoA isomerase